MPFLPWDLVKMLDLPRASEISLCVLVSFPPRYRMVSELPKMVSYLSLYSSLIWAIFWMIVLLDMFLERMVASSLV